MTKKNNILLGFDDIVEGFKLSDGHGLVLDKVEVDIVAKKSVNADKGQHFSLIVH
jgi:hypothetical protein